LIDYVKIFVDSVDVERLCNLSYLDFRVSFNTITNEVSNKSVAEHHFCKITIYDSGIVLFTGSIHKMYNSLNNIIAPNYKNDESYKGFNGNQFSLINILEVRSYLLKLFDCQPQQLEFKNIEFGINTEVFFNPNLFIRGLLYHNGKQFEYRYHNNYSQAVHQQFIIKIYNKGSQYEMEKNTLRFELKYRKMIQVNRLGIITFADINAATLDNVKHELLRRFDEVVYYDYTISKNSLSKTLKNKTSKYSNPRYWLVDLVANHRYREKLNLKEMIINHADNLHKQIRQEIIKKCVIINRVLESVNV
jgi:hypothetical protein